MKIVENVLDGESLYACYDLIEATTIFPKYSINQLKELKNLERVVERAILPERANIKKQKKINCNIAL